MFDSEVRVKHQVSIPAEFDLVNAAVATRSGTGRSTALGRAAAGRSWSTAAGLAAATCTPLAAKTGQEADSLVTTAGVAATAVAATAVTARSRSCTAARIVAATVVAARSRSGAAAGVFTAS